MPRAEDSAPAEGHAMRHRIHPVRQLLEHRFIALISPGAVPDGRGRERQATLLQPMPGPGCAGVRYATRGLLLESLGQFGDQNLACLLG